MITFDNGYEIKNIIIVGLGGTGSQLARTVCRTVYNRMVNRQSVPSITFVDPDIVESHNVGRQMFAPADIGRHKAEVLATRFNRALGLEVQYFNDAFNPSFHIHQTSTLFYRQRQLVIGCVDNYRARQSLAEANALVIDCGNHFDSGQVVIGNTDNWQYVRRQYDVESVAQDTGLSTSEAKSRIDEKEWLYLPSPYLVFPELLEKPERDIDEPLDDLSCAELVERDSQHLLINEYVALAAGQYVYKLLHRQPITSYMTVVDSDMMLMQPKPITPAAIDHYYQQHQSESHNDLAELAGEPA